MVKNKFIIAILLVSLMLSVLVGCQVQNADVPTEPSASSQPTELTEPSSEATEPSSEATEPTETVCPRTIEAFKAHLTPYMTYGEAKAVFGRLDTDLSDTNEHKEVIWYLEDDYYIEVFFYATANEHRDEYLVTMPTGKTDSNGTPIDVMDYIIAWNAHMEAYSAYLYKGTPSGKCELMEVWFDYGAGPFQPEA